MRPKPFTIRQKKLYIEHIRDQFRGRKSISTIDLAEYYRSIDPDITKSTINWRIYKLVQEGIMSRIARGKFILGATVAYKPDLSNEILALDKKLKSDFPYLPVCLWNTSIYNEFMLHQPGRYYRLIEVERDARESIFYYLKDKNYSVYMEPSLELITRYVADEKEPWIVKTLVSEAPIQSVNGLLTVTIEKALVDILLDPVIFDAQQGSEMHHIYKEAFGKYTISESKMLRYANRRKKKEVLNKYLNVLSK